MKHVNPVRPSIEEAPKLELKALPPHLRYVFFGRFETLPITIASDFNVKQVQYLVDVLNSSNDPLVGLLKTLLGSILVDVHTKSNSYQIKIQVMSTRDG